MLNEILDICTLNFIIPFEGEGPKDSEGNSIAYLCPAGVPTISVGLTFDEFGNKVKLGDVWDEAKASRTARKVLLSFLNDLLLSSPSLSNQTPCRVASVLSWVYNLGMSNYNKSTFKKRIDNSDWEYAAFECKKWTRSNGIILRGLTIRRDKEAIVIRSGII